MLLIFCAACVAAVAMEWYNGLSRSQGRRVLYTAVRRCILSSAGSALIANVLIYCAVCIAAVAIERYNGLSSS
jgi:hypothetical protein